MAFEDFKAAFDITDYTGSIRVTRFMEQEEAKPIIEGVKWARVGAPVYGYRDL